MKATNLKPSFKNFELHLFVRDSKHSEEALKTEDSESEVKWKNYSDKCLLVMGRVNYSYCGYYSYYGYYSYDANYGYYFYYGVYTYYSYYVYYGY